MLQTSAASVLLVNWLKGTFDLKACIFHGQTFQLSPLCLICPPALLPPAVWWILPLPEGGGPWEGAQQSFGSQTSTAAVVVFAIRRAFWWLEFPHGSHFTVESGALMSAVQSSGRTEGEGKQQ